MPQRNLYIIGSDNPGDQVSHTVTDPFTIRALRCRDQENNPDAARNDDPEDTFDGEPAALTGEMDELWLWLGNIPEQSTVTLFVPQLDAGEMLGLAAERTGPTVLRQRDQHTVTVQTGSLAAVPLPPLQNDIPALLTIELPPGQVRRGDRHDVQVQQLGGAEHAILGGFTITVPVQKASELLPDEANWLAILRHNTGTMDERDRRIPVLARYLERQARKVNGLGGHSEDIPPSPFGAPRHRPPCRRSRLLALGILLAAIAAARAVQTGRWA